MTTKHIKPRLDNDFKRGAKTSSSIMTGGELTPVQVQMFMETSFYLPVDVLKRKDWHVLPIQVITGEQFQQAYGDVANVHCIEDYHLLKNAQFVAVSTRRQNFSREYFHVAKIWYGKEPV